MTVFTAAAGPGERGEASLTPTLLGTEKTNCPNALLDWSSIPIHTMPGWPSAHLIILAYVWAII